MNFRKLDNNILLASNCPHPRKSEEVCQIIAKEGSDSLLIVGEDNTPWVTELSGLWCYIRPLADEANPLSNELQRITDFVNYETAHNRTVTIWIGYPKLENIIIQAALAKPPKLEKRKASDDPLCCHPYHDGCLGELACHAAPLEAAVQIFKSGKLLTRSASTNKPITDITKEMRRWGQPDPPDYFDYICLANGNCVAPDIVAIQRHAGIWLDNKKCEEVFYPGIRFFFDPKKLATHPRVAWDGIQAIKVKDSIDLAEYLGVAIVPEVDRGNNPLHLEIPSYLRGKIQSLDHREHCGLSAWSTKAFEIAKTFMVP